MTKRSAPNVQVIDLEPGLWLWRLEHPHWSEGEDWPEVVTSVCVDAGTERWVIDPLLPPDDTTEVWRRFAERPPTAVVILIGDHLRETWSDQTVWSVDALVDRYGCRTFGPNAFDQDMIKKWGRPKVEGQQIVPGRELPGGLLPFRDVRGWAETPLYLPQHRTLVFGDGMTERAGSLRVWMSPTHEERALPDLRAMLALPFERVIVSHGEPVHSREAFERALDLPPWPATSLHIAAWRGDLDQVRRLVHLGADLTALSDNSGLTPLEWAVNASENEGSRAPGHDEVIAYLTSVMKQD
ncbi:ankyrin repeat domain-containing protein [Microlunatus speluncae]|uniref:ankyrin repeat domain-containing protein n=1 Tax=Microlunatus speluncae TaxID=2594267 RepID=UPI0012667995|nr:ankyrin repeat domain-containing protein [Microlunatus speluncae]